MKFTKLDSSFWWKVVSDGPDLLKIFVNDDTFCALNSLQGPQMFPSFFS